MTTKRELFDSVTRLFVGAVVFLALVGRSALGVPPPQGYWPLDGNGNDLSGFDRTTILQGGVSFTNGLFNQALDLPNDARKFAERPVDDAVFDFGSSNFTIQVWVNSRGTSSDQVLIEKFQGTMGPGWSLAVLNGGVIHFWATPAAVLYSSPLSITPGVWHQIVVRRSGATVQCLFDTNRVASADAGTTAISDTSNGLLLGRRNAADGRGIQLDGRLDEVAIWNLALSDEDIAQLYNGGAGQPVFSKYPALYWSETSRYLVGGVVRLDWKSYVGDMTGLSVALLADKDGKSTTLGVGLGISTGVLWDTTGVADGIYSVHANLIDGQGRVVDEVSRFLCVNNTVGWHRGTIVGDETWTSNTVQVVDQNLVIPAGVTVTIEPGTIIKFSDGVSIMIQEGGVLNALGTVQSPVIMTSFRDDSAGGDTNLDGDKSKPQPGDWAGIAIQGSALLNQNEFTDIRYLRTTHSGTLQGGETWAGTRLHEINGDLIVPAGATLVINAGAVIKFAPLKGISVQPTGRLIANGSVAQPIVFTSYRDDSVGGDSNGDGSSSAPAPGDWAAISADGGEIVLNHCVVAYGAGTPSGGYERGAGAIRNQPSSALHMNACAVRDAMWEGVCGLGGVINLTNCVIRSCDRAIMAYESVATLANCTLYDNRIGLWPHGGTFIARNCIISHSLEVGIDPSGTFDVRNCDVWSPSGVNGYFTPGLNGNISTDPKFKNAAQGDYRLNYRSPCIDSGDGLAAPPADSMGAPRYDDPRTANTGLSCTNGAYADMGAFEFVETADSMFDVIALDVSGPSSVEAGTKAVVTWKVRNIGSSSFTAAWHDKIMLVPQNPGPHDQTLTAAEVLSNGTLGPGQDKEFSAVVRVPGGTEGQWRWAVQANSRGEVFEGALWTNNTDLANSPADLVVPEIPTNGIPVVGRFDRAGEPCWFKFTPGGDQDVLVTLDRDGTNGWTKLYLGDGYVPTEQDFLAQDKTWLTPDVSIGVSGTADRSYYVMAWPGALPDEGASFTIKAEIQAFGIQSPSDVVTVWSWGGGTRVLRIDGAGFTESTVFALRDSSSNLYAPTQVVIIDSTRAELTLDAGTLPPGGYDLLASSGEQSTEAHDYLTVYAGQPPATMSYSAQHLPCILIRPSGLSFQVGYPGPIRWGRTARVSIEYKNYTEWYVFAPLVRITVSGVAFRFVDEARFGSGWLSSAVVPITGNGATPGRVLHGEGGSIELEVYAIPGNAFYSVSVHGASENNQSMNWDAHKAELKPDFISTEAWDPIFNNFKNGIGTTFAAVNESIAYDVEYLSGLGQAVYDLNRLLAFELNRAGLLTIARRYTLGAFGRGRPGFWELAAQEAADGQVTVYYGTIPWRRFDRQPDGTYAGSAGEYASLVLTNGVFRLREKDGVVAQFNSAGALDYTEDPNGKRSTFNYAGGQLTSITDTKGDVTTVQWSPAGRVTNITDAVGREVSFAYDASGEHLESVSSAQGTTRFTYTGGASAASRHAVASIAFPDGTHQYYEYDSQGRITRAYRDGGQEATVYGYGSWYSTRGAAYVQPSGGGTTWIYYGADGNIAKIVGPSQENLEISRDASGNPTSVVGPGGAKVSLNYDGLGNVGQWEDPQGNRFSASYDGLFSQLTSLRDARGNTKSYGYDGVGNLASIRYPGGGAEHYQYDARGNVTNWINGRGQSIGYTYDAKDLLVQKTYPDGQVAVYDYDAHRNLTSVSNQTGVLALQYDAADRVTRVTYPNGRYLRYDYDSGGRRTNMVDENGFAVGYSYDAQGRLAALRDGSGAAIVTYTYDNAGQLIRRDRANSTHSTYAYDPSGRMVNLVHFGATNQVVSSYAYRYDTAGRPTTMTTLEGTWTYAYDQLGQLTRVVTPAGRTIAYAYDAAGNRTSVTDDGVKTYYIANQDDQYTQVGGDLFSFDADGNQIGRTGPGGSQTFGYNALSRMVSSVTAEGTLDFEYDELGGLRRASRDGVQTDYLIDPFGLGNVVGEYSVSGNPEATYIHGLGLEAVQRPDGTHNYFSHERMGNTVQLVDEAGTVLNSYEYLPFGEKLSSSEGVRNRNTFSGAYGVMEIGQGSAYTRARVYDSGLGRFCQRDPIGLQGGDASLYRYVKNSPTRLIDPSGLVVVMVGYSVTGGINGKGLTGGRYLAWDGTSFLPKVVTTFGGGFSSGKGIQGGKEILINWGRDTSISDIIRNPASASVGIGAGGGNVYGGISVDDSGSLTTYLGVGVGAKGIDVSLFGTQSTVSDPTPYDINSLWAGEPLALGVLIGEFLQSILGSGQAPVVGSYDPNDIVGPGGYSDQRWITSQEVLRYVIHFENVSNATAAAQFIVVTNQMDSDLDLATFELDQFGFGTNVFDIPAGLNSYSKRIDMRQENGLYVDFSANLDVNTGVATWRFDSIDPITGLATEDPIAGFLPPNASPPCGEGFVSYTIQCRSNVVSGSTIEAVAEIVFDVNEVIATPRITNRVDAVAPASFVLGLPPISPRNFDVTWSGTDVDSGIACWNVFVSEDSGTWTNWVAGATNTSATFTGRYGHTYAFYSLAQDNLGSWESKTPTNEAVTAVSNNGPPYLAGISNCLIAVGQRLVITNHAVDPDLPLVFGLGAGAPAGASINATNGVFRWRPTCSQSSSTNLIRVTVTDSGWPALSSSQDFIVVVTECIDISAGGAVMRPGDYACVPVQLLSGTAVTNLSFNLVFTAGRLTNFSLAAFSSQVQTARFDLLGPDAVSVSATPQGAFQGPMEILQVCFQAAPAQSSAFVPLTPVDILGAKPDGEPVGNVAGQTARIVIVGEEPLLEARLSTNGQPLIVLYAPPGSTNRLETVARLGTGESWSVGEQVVMPAESLFQLIQPAILHNSLFIRARRQ